MLMIKNTATVISSCRDNGRMHDERKCERAHGHVGQGEHIQQDIALVQLGNPSIGVPGLWNPIPGGGCWKYWKRGSLIGVASL